MTFAAALKGKEGVLLVADRLEFRKDEVIEVRKLYRHPWGFITGYGKGHLLTPAKECLETHPALKEPELSILLQQFTPMQVVHDCLVGAIGELVAAGWESGETTFLYSLPADCVPASFSQRPNTHPLAVVVDNLAKPREVLGHANNIFEDDATSQQYRRLISSMTVPLRELDYLLREVLSFLSRKAAPEEISAVLDIGFHYTDGELASFERTIR